MTQRKEHSRFFLALDCAMLGLILFNLSWIFFDALFESKSFKNIIEWLSADFYQFYLPIHEDFLRYDLIFVAIYLVEFNSRWLRAIYKNTYAKWYLFPVYHWYDILGCIPIGAFHFLRVLRIIVILKKLQDLKVIQWQETFLIRTYQKYTSILTEEISDRVVAQVLDGMSAELQQGTPVLHQVVSKAVLPRTEEIGQWLSHSMTHLIHSSYDSRKAHIHAEIRLLVKEAASKNKDLKRMMQLPVFGGLAGEMLERTITHMIFDITDQIIDYLRSDLCTEVISEGLASIFDSLADPKSDANHLVQTILLDTIEVLKQQVQIQQWKENYG